MTSTNLDNFEGHQCAMEVTMQEAELRNHGAKAKAAFTRSRNALLLMVELEIMDACLDMDICMEKAMELLSKCASFYIENKMLQKVYEMEKLETDFYEAYEVVWAHLGQQNKSRQVFEKVGILGNKDIRDSIRKTVKCTSPNLSSQTLQTETDINTKAKYETNDHNTTKLCATVEILG